MKKSIIINKLNQEKTRSAWSKGVKVYALELLRELEQEELPENSKELKKLLLNGADSWKDYSWGGCSLIYDKDICERLATSSEKKRTRGGELKPNKLEEWLDTQARALHQAFNLIESQMGSF